ncbi:MAG TPA: hypothetical protein VGQ36_20790 [Thermoanaerobaculia bacterium]|nr:hypothetical protein [Thermoanaerobaculia bacterium]
MTSIGDDDPASALASDGRLHLVKQRILMDTKNRFHTKETWLWTRAESIAIMLVLSLMVILHAREVHWGRFIFAFAIIDLIGYIPGAVAYRRKGGGKIAPIYHHLYNVTHSFLTGGAAVALWTWTTGAPEWAMLAIPIHLLGDRGIFGNIYKPTELQFEPVAHELLPTVSTESR